MKKKTKPTSQELFPDIIILKKIPDRKWVAGEKIPEGRHYRWYCPRDGQGSIYHDVVMHKSDGEPFAPDVEAYEYEVSYVSLEEAEPGD